MKSGADPGRTHCANRRNRRLTPLRLGTQPKSEATLEAIRAERRRQAFYQPTRAAWVTENKEKSERKSYAA